MSAPQVWHHGLVARCSAALWSDPGGDNAAFFGDLIGRAGQPALDLGCGTGRLLLPYLQAGLDVDGCDTSADMLAACQGRAAAAGLAPRLYRQAMHELDLPRRYRLIYACGVVGLGGQRALLRQGLRRCHDQLAPGGLLAFDYEPRYNSPGAWMSRLPEQRHSLPEPWGDDGERRPLPDGSEVVVEARTIFVDPLAERQGRQLRVQLYRDGALVEEQVQTQHYDELGVNELLLLLELAGFADVRLLGGYRDEPATADHSALIFMARRGER